MEWIFQYMVLWGLIVGEILIKHPLVGIVVGIGVLGGVAQFAERYPEVFGTIVLIGFNYVLFWILDGQRPDRFALTFIIGLAVVFSLLDRRDQKIKALEKRIEEIEQCGDER
jgi:hypothetical protein